VTVDRGRYSPQSPILRTLSRIGMRQRKSAQDQDHAHLPRSKTRGINLLLRNHSHLEGMFLRPALTATFWVRYLRGYHL
jgi:hypothetical protein